MQSEETIHPEELLSATFDGEFDSAVDIPAERRAKLEQDWESIRSAIQAARSEPVDLVSAVRAEIETKQPALAARPSGTLRRNSWLIAVPGLISAAAVLFFGILPLLQKSDMAPEVGSLLRMSAVYGSDWDVVVVNISDDSKLQDSIRAVLGTAEQQGAGVERLATQIDDGAEYSAGILLADGGDSLAIVNSLEDSHQQLEWNPSEIDGRSHEEIKQLFLSSMEIPSQSEKVFGEMYVVREDSLAVIPVPVDSDADVSSGVAELADIEPVDQPLIAARSQNAPAATSKAQAGTKPKTPLVVIFRRPGRPAKPPAIPGPGQSSGQAGNQANSLIRQANHYLAHGLHHLGMVGDAPLLQAVTIVQNRANLQADHSC